jgi:hypothetical protein
VALPFVYKSFAAVFTADVAVLAGLYTWKGIVPFSPVSRAEAQEAPEE